MQLARLGAVRRHQHDVATEPPSLALERVRVGGGTPDRTGEPARGVRRVRERPRDVACGERLSHGEAPTSGLQATPDDLGKRLVVRAPHVLAEPRADRLLHLRDTLIGFFWRGPLVGDTNVHAVVLRVRRDRGARRPHQLGESLFGRALADTEELEGPPPQRAASGQRRLDRFPHRSHLPGHTRHRDDPFAVLLNIPAGGRAVRIRERASRGDEPGLLAITVGHDHAATREPREEYGLERGVDLRGLTERGRDGFPCQVVLGRPETPGRHDQVASGERSLERLLGAWEVVADRLHVETIDAEERKPAGKVVGVRIDDLAEQQLGPDGEELSLHQKWPESRPGPPIRLAWHLLPLGFDNKKSQPFPSSPRTPAERSGFCGRMWSRGRARGLGYAAATDNPEVLLWQQAIASSARPPAK